MKWVVLVIGVSLLFIAAYFFAEGMNLEKTLDEFSAKKEDEIKTIVGRIKTGAKKEISEKYGMELASFEKLSKELDAQRKKKMDLEGELLRMKK